MLIHHAPDGYWTGQSREVEARDPVPRGWIVAPSPPEAPAGMVVMWADGWVIAELPAPTLGELRDQANAAVNAKREAVFAAGFPVSGGALDGQHLQLRNADDKANWLIVDKNARLAVAAGAGDVPLIPVRTLENQTITVTPNQALAVLADLEAWGQAVLARSWALKDQNDAATEAGDLVGPAELETGWP